MTYQILKAKLTRAEMVVYRILQFIKMINKNRKCLINT